MAKAKKHHKKLQQPVSWTVAIPIIVGLAILAGYFLMSGLGQSQDPNGIDQADQLRYGKMMKK